VTRQIIIKDEYKSPPSASVVMYYWYRQAVAMSDRDQRLPIWLSRATLDIGEPRCWGCGNYSSEWDYTEWKSAPCPIIEASIEDLCKNWNRLSLQICHIIPRSRGGTHHPHNLVLMCHVCHDEAPDCTDRHYFIDWLDNRAVAYRDRKFREFQDACKALGLSIEEMGNISEIITLDQRWNEFRDYQADFSSLHWGSGGVNLKLTSWVSAMHSFYYEKYNQFPVIENESALQRFREGASLGDLS